MTRIAIVGPDGQIIEPQGVMLRPVDGPINDAQVIAQVAAVMIAKGRPVQSAVDDAIEALARSAVLVRAGVLQAAIDQVAESLGLKKPKPDISGGN